MLMHLVNITVKKDFLEQVMTLNPNMKMRIWVS